MFKALWNKLTGRQADGFKPSKGDKELMENVKARLTLMDGLDQPEGTVIRTIPGATVRFLPLAGGATPTVFANNRPVGSITPDGQIVYVQPMR